MPNFVSNQAYIFFWSIIGGMLIAFIYDIFRIQRKAIKTTSIVLYLEDLVYWIIVALVMFTVVYYSNDGEIRGYIFIGTVLGVILYIVLLSRWVIGISLFVLRAIYRVLKFTLFVILYPIKIILKILSVPTKFLLKFLRRFLKIAKRAGKTGAARTNLWRRVFRNMRKKI